MSDADLVKRLRDHAEWGECGPKANDGKLLKAAAGRIEALAAEVERLKAERVSHVDYSVDLQRIIECICHKRDIRTPVTTARYHFDLAVKYRAEAESAESALAEAIEIMRPLVSAVLHAQPALKDHASVRAARDFITAQEKEKGK